MDEPISLKLVNKRMSELIREYDTHSEGSRGAPILEELSQLTVIRDELKKIQGKTSRAEPGARKSTRKFSTPAEALFDSLNGFAVRIIKTSMKDPQRSELVNDFTRLCLIADSLIKDKSESL